MQNLLRIIVVAGQCQATEPGCFCAWHVVILSDPCSPLACSGNPFIGFASLGSVSRPAGMFRY